MTVGMTVQEMASYVGKRASLPFRQMVVDVEIHDVRENFGRIDVLVSPLMGTGETWVQLDRLEVQDDSEYIY